MHFGITEKPTTDYNIIIYKKTASNLFNVV